MSFTVAEFIGTLGLEVNESDFKRADKYLRELGSGLMAMFKRVSLIGGIASAGLAKLGLDSASAADAVKDSAESLGMAVDRYQELATVFKRFGLEAKQMDQSFRNIARAQAEAGRGGDIARIFKGIGIEVKDLKGLKPDEAFDKIVEGLGKTEDVTMRTVAAQRILGEELAGRIMPAVKDGAGEFNRMREELKGLGLTMSKEQIEKGAKTFHQMQRLNLVFKAMREQIGFALVPVLGRAADMAVEFWVSNRKWITEKVELAAEKISDGFEWLTEKMKEADTFVKDKLGGWETVISTIGGAFAAAGIIKFFMGLKTAMAVIMPLITGFSIATVIAAAKIILIAAAIVALILILQDLYIYLTGGESAIGKLIESMKDSGGIVAQMAEFFELFIEVLGELGRVIWDVVVLAFEAFWAATEPVRVLLTDVGNAVLEFLKIVGRFTLGKMIDALKKAMPLLKKFREFIATVSPDVVEIAADAGKQAADVTGVTGASLAARAAEERLASANSNAATSNNSSNITVNQSATVNAQTNASPEQIASAVTKQMSGQATEAKKLAFARNVGSER